jgi:prepilin-type N-terminal cleavage/methylation domain-containing protein
MPAAIQKNERQPYRLEVRPPSVRAFTLIEVMVVVAIIGIMAGIVIIPLGNGRIERELEANAREFVGVVREAQNYALTGRQAVAGTDPCRFHMSWSGSNYTLTYWYKDAGGTCNQTSPMAAYTLKNGVVFGNSDTLYFTLPHANLDFSTGSRGATLTKQSISHIACVYADGRISDQSGASCP